MDESAGIRVILKSFYAVTRNSIYLVSIPDPGQEVPRIVKMGRGDSSNLVEVTKSMSGKKDDTVSVGNVIYSYNSNQSGTDSISGMLMSGCTSNIIALFVTERDALICSRSQNLAPVDTRWRQQTARVLKAIGKEHPFFSIAGTPDFWLMPEAEWQRAE